jgi:hypothetical protein
MYFGTYTFLIIALFVLMDFIAAFVEFAKKVYNNLPVRIYTGKVLPPFPYQPENTKVNTMVVNIGSKSVHNKPR